MDEEDLERVGRMEVENPSGEKEVWGVKEPREE